MATFVAVDLETANPQTASVCHIATATFDGDRSANALACIW